MDQHTKILKELIDISQQFFKLIQSESWEVIEEMISFINRFGNHIGSNSIITEEDQVSLHQLKSDNPVMFANAVYNNLLLLIEEYTQFISVQDHIGIVKNYTFADLNFAIIKDESGNAHFIYETGEMIENVKEELNHDTEAIILVGFGSGDLVEKLKLDYQVMVVEPYHIYNSPLDKEIISFKKNTHLELQIQKELQRFIGLKVKMIIHPSYTHFKESIAALKSIRASFQQIQIELNTRVLYTEKWYQQYYMNSSILKENSNRIINIDRLEKFHRGEPALMIAGGPSLEDAIPYLKEAQFSYYIVAIGQVAKVLLNNGISPDYIISTDSELRNAHFFKDVKIDIPLIYPLQVNHLVPGSVDGKLIPYADNSVTRDILSYSEKKISPAPSVAISAVLFMDYVGFSAIGLIGQDLALRNGEYYSSSVKNESSNDGQLNNTLYEIELNSGIAGKTTPVLADFLSNYNRLIESRPTILGKLTNYAEHGAKINQIPYSPLSNLMQDKIRKRMISNESIDLTPSIQIVNQTFKRILVKLEVIKKKIHRFANQQAMSKVDFEKSLREWDKTLEIDQFKTHVMPLQIVNMLTIQNRIKSHNYLGQTSDVRLEIIKSMNETLDVLISQLKMFIELEE